METPSPRPLFNVHKEVAAYYASATPGRIAGPLPVVSPGDVCMHGFPMNHDFAPSRPASIDLFGRMRNPLLGTDASKGTGFCLLQGKQKTASEICLRSIGTAQRSFEVVQPFPLGGRVSLIYVFRPTARPDLVLCLLYYAPLCLVNRKIKFF